jgi:D-beta-D-heptose 7-phosphate kinase/D-beta-D-heptose 1-phosphate adenosyltransferase
MNIYKFSFNNIAFYVKKNTKIKMKYNDLLNLKENKILVIGDIMLDKYVYGNCHRISPEAPVPIIEFKNEEDMLGGSGNVLKNLISFGANCDIISVLGDDIAGGVIIENIKKNNISIDNIVIDKTRKTTEKIRIISSNQQLIRIDKEDKFSINQMIEDCIISKIKENVKNYDVILLSDYSKGFLTRRLCSETIKLANENNILTIVDPKGDDYIKFEKAKIFKPNRKEAELFLNKKLVTKEDIKNACIDLKTKLKCESVVITLSEYGIALYDTEFHLIPTSDNKISDVSGAGDTVLASMAICLLKQYSLYDACEFSNKAASIVVRKFGSVTTTVQEIINLN